MAKSTKRDPFGDTTAGVRVVRGHREARHSVRARHIMPLSLPSIDEHTIRNTREGLHLSRSAFARRLGVNPRTLERWEKGRSKPNDQAVALILLVRRYPDTLTRLKALAES